MVCNVQSDEDDVLDAMIERNLYLNSISDVKTKIKFVLKKHQRYAELSLIVETKLCYNGEGMQCVTGTMC